MYLKHICKSYIFEITRVISDKGIPNIEKKHKIHVHYLSSTEYLGREVRRV